MRNRNYKKSPKFRIRFHFDPTEFVVGWTFSSNFYLHNLQIYCLPMCCIHISIMRGWEFRL